MSKSLHPYHCVLCGAKLYELGLGTLGCGACCVEFLPTSDAGATGFSLSWIPSNDRAVAKCAKPKPPTKKARDRSKPSKASDQRAIVIHTDGSASVKDETGGWGFIARYGDTMQDRSGFAHPSTISEMELMAIIRALQFLKPTSIPVRIYSDSQYAVNVLTKWGPNWRKYGWKTSAGKDVAHVELIKAGLKLLDYHSDYHKVDIQWIRGHAGHADNELADSLAGQARRDGSGSWKPEDDKFYLHYQQETTNHGKHHQTKDSTQGD